MPYLYHSYYLVVWYSARAESWCRGVVATPGCFVPPRSNRLDVILFPATYPEWEIGPRISSERFLEIFSSPVRAESGGLDVSE